VILIAAVSVKKLASSRQAAVTSATCKACPSAHDGFPQTLLEGTAKRSHKPGGPVSLAAFTFKPG